MGGRDQPGVAIDASGRLIIVPDVVQLMPLTLTDEDGVPLPPGEPARAR